LSTCPSGAAAGPAQSASRRSAALNPRACNIRAIRRGAQGVATVTHGQVGAGDQDRHSRRSAANPGARTSKLVMRVRFPSSAPAHRKLSLLVSSDCAQFTHFVPDRCARRITSLPPQ
jgi:hypothetical protein